MATKIDEMKNKLRELEREIFDIKNNLTQELQSEFFDLAFILNRREALKNLKGATYLKLEHFTEAFKAELLANSCTDGEGNAYVPSNELCKFLFTIFKCK